MSLPIDFDYAVMEAVSANTIPAGPEWQYEPKWDGFRCLAFRDGAEIQIMSKAGQPLARYFPEIEAALLALTAKKFVLDGELIVTQERTARVVGVVRGDKSERTARVVGVVRGDKSERTARVVGVVRGDKSEHTAPVVGVVRGDKSERSLDFDALLQRIHPAESRIRK